ncbi:WXG100 family type VII secretion target [Lactobacillus curvatus]|uniref:WXG100 family type VII secretion target n=1 Tax=Latilactobacillus fragifolii TaxID=2814244 RepID=UPI0012B067F0|nr:WXG100 family type VII secretion target [Latilactobacillus fragifolii]MSD82999.1 WXG100 family type VII secretion target [Latilactobacillus curvatus]MSE23096.1 WXG100 family type VII secretion target [Latilactobacillus curvatus]
MAQISVTPEQLMEQSKVYLRAKEGIEREIQTVNAMNNTIHEEWQGSAFEAYLEQYNQLYGQVTKFEELLESINSQLNKYAQTVAERDAQDAKSFGF